MLSPPPGHSQLLLLSRGMADTLTSWCSVASVAFSAEDSTLWGPVFWGVTASAGFSESPGSAVAETASCCVLMFSVGLTFLLTSLSSGLSDSSLMGLSFLLGYIKKTALLFRKYKCLSFLLVDNHNVHISELQTSKLNILERWQPHSWTGPETWIKGFPANTPNRVFNHHLRTLQGHYENWHGTQRSRWWKHLRYKTMSFLS